MPPKRFRNPDLASTPQRQCSPNATYLQMGLFTRLQKLLFSKSNFIFPQSIFAIQDFHLTANFYKKDAVVAAPKF